MERRRSDTLDLRSPERRPGTSGGWTRGGGRKKKFDLPLAQAYVVTGVGPERCPGRALNNPAFAGLSGSVFQRGEGDDEDRAGRRIF